jgi:hypothetical protein
MAAETGGDGDGISKFIEREEEEEDILLLRLLGGRERSGERSKSDSVELQIDLQKSIHVGRALASFGRHPSSFLSIANVRLRLLTTQKPLIKLFALLLR